MTINTINIGIIHSGLNNQNHDKLIIAKKFKNSKNKYTIHINSIIAFISALLYFSFLSVFICSFNHFV